jgi:hypothetical protein
MSDLIRFDHPVAGYRPGDVVDLELLAEPRDRRIAAALEAGYAVAVGGVVEVPEVPLPGDVLLVPVRDAQAPAKPAKPRTPARKAAGRQRRS